MKHDQAEQDGRRQCRGDQEIGVGGGEDVAEQQALDPRRGIRGEGEERPEPEEGGNHHGHRGVPPDPGHPADQRDGDGGDCDPRDAAGEQWDPDQRRDDQPGEEGVGERLRRVRDAVEDDPAAQGAARQRDQPDLHQCPADELLPEWVCEEVDHQW
jgi:hypothetical protein